MRYLFLILFVPSVAFAEDCSCLSDSRLTQSCIDFSYTDAFFDCENVPSDHKRVAALEDRADAIELQLRGVANLGNRLNVVESQLKRVRASLKKKVKK